MDNLWILFCFVFMLLALIFMLTIMKLHVIIGLLLSTILLGVLTGIPAKNILYALTGGFGDTMNRIGIAVMLGCILSFYLEMSGAIDELAKWIILKTSVKHDVFAVGVTACIVVIPIFFGVAYILLAPLCIRLSKLTGRNILCYVCSLTIGLLLISCCVPPAPGPLAMAVTLDGNIGWFIFYGIIVIIPALLVFCKLYPKCFDKKEIRPNTAKIEELH